MRYPVVLLDVGDTLIRPREAFGVMYARVYRGLGLGIRPQVLDSCLRRAWSEVAAEIPSGTDRYGHFPGGEEEFWLRVSRATLERATGRSHEESFCRTALDRLREIFVRREAWTVYPEVPSTLRALRAAGVRLGIVSNWDSRLPRILDVLGLTDSFEAVGVSHLEGCEKPSPVLFRRVLERMHADPGQALHVGDIPELDIAGARAAGVDAVLVDRRARHDGAYPTIRDLAVLPDLVRTGLA